MTIPPSHSPSLSQATRNDSRLSVSCHTIRPTPSSSLFLPALYLRERDPAAEQVRQSLRSAVKSVELYLRCQEIEKLDVVHGKLWDLLRRGGRDRVTVEEYQEVMRRFDAWYTAAWVEEPGSQPCPTPSASPHAADAKANRHNTDDSPPDAAEAEKENQDEGTAKDNENSGRALLGASGGAWSCSHSHNRSTADWLRSFAEVVHPTSRRSAEGGEEEEADAERDRSCDHHGSDGGTSVAKVMYLPCVPSPRLTMELYLSCARSTHSTDVTTNSASAASSTGLDVAAAADSDVDAVDIASIYHAFAKRVSLVKCEAELMMWDMNNDGKLTEGDLEGYMRDLVPRIAALHTLTDDVLLFYCCAASRRIMWDLDPNNRGMLRIDALLRSAVMEEWLNLQLATEDNLQNWFGVSITRFIVEKFMLLDKRNAGTLTAEDLSHYKKGLPVVTDDGLPIDVSPLCSLFVDRFFETNLMTQTAEMDFRKFTDFVIAVEMLPQCSRPLFFWNILDLHSTGVLTPLTVNYFFRETHAKLVSVGLDAPSREIVVQEVFDLITTAQPLLITRDEFVQSPQAGLFASLLIDCLSFWSYENREQRGL